MRKLVIFVTALFALIVMVMLANMNRGITFVENDILWLTRIIGLYLVTVSSLAMLLTAMGDAPMQGKYPLFLFSFLAGSFLLSMHWSSICAITALAITAQVKEVVLSHRQSGQHQTGT